MSRKTIIYIGFGIGSIIGGLIPSLWGADILSFSSMILSGIGGFAGIWIAYKYSG